ncbi:MAG: DUF1385 domain-containing protein [Butyrivibrio sp.]|nr:DUF1385 domain-containing protein [Butyrivibrio sp.]
MFDYFNKHKLTFDNDVSEPKRKPKKDKVFIAIMIVFAVILVVGFVTGVGTVSSDGNIEENFKFRFNITDGIFILGLVIGYVVMHIRKGRGH